MLTLDAGTDIWAVKNDYISITPLDNDVTAHSILPRMEELKLAIEDGLREGSPPEGPRSEARPEGRDLVVHA